MCSQHLCLCSDILIVWGIFSLSNLLYLSAQFWQPTDSECSNSATCRFLVLKFSNPLYLSAQFWQPVIFLHKIHGIPANRTTPPSYVRLNLSNRWILSAENWQLTVFIRGRDTYSTILLPLFHNGMPINMNTTL